MLQVHEYLYVEYYMNFLAISVFKGKIET